MDKELSGSADSGIPLLEMIETLRQELAASVTSSQGKALRFSVEDVEIEVRVQVRRDRSAGGKLGFWVISAGADWKSAREDVHVFRLKLKPELESANGVLVSDHLLARPRQTESIEG